MHRFYKPVSWLNYPLVAEIWWSVAGWSVAGCALISPLPLFVLGAGPRDLLSSHASSFSSLNLTSKITKMTKMMMMTKIAKMTIDI
jgi:hypothetical protein